MRVIFCSFVGMLLSWIITSPAIEASAQPAHQPEEAFEAFWSLYDENYALFDQKRIEWDAVYRAYRPEVTENMSRADLFEMFVEITDLLNDVHVTVEDLERNRSERSGGQSIGRGAFDNGEFSLDLITDAYVRGSLETRAGGVIRFGWLQNNVGYLRVEAFKYETSTEQALDEFVDAFSSARAVIIDVRQNGGGADRIGQLIAERFASERTKYMSSQVRIPSKDERRYADPVDWYLEPSTSNRYDRPVFILTNSRTISAAENFVLAMRALPNSTIVGDVTAGAMADTISITIDGGWRFSVPINIFRDAEGVCWEGVGLAPQFWQSNAPEEVASGQDRVLETALRLTE